MKPNIVHTIGKLAYLFSLMIIAVVPVVGHAATFTVNSTADAVAANPAGGICETAAGNGICTLRAAIQVANASLAVADTIILPAGTYTFSIPGTNEDLAANGDLDIRGPGGALTISGAGAATTIIDGGAIEGVFETIVVAGTGANVTISGVTIRNGNSTIGHGGGIHVGNTAVGTSVTLNNVIVTACKALGANAGASGVDNSGTLNMNTVAVTNNDGPGGAVNNGRDGVLTWNIGEVSGNTTGGGIQNNGSITLTNVTISGNSPTQGAGIDNDVTGTATLLNVTISGNSSTAGLAAIGGIRNATGGTLLIRNTIISGNTPFNCSGLVNVSLGNNLDSGNTCGLSVALGDLINTDPLLGALALNGGALQTLALPAGSPAIDAGSATVCPSTDARGIARPVDGNPVPPAVTAICDMGAYEFRPQKITVTLASPFDFGTVTSGTTADHVITLANAGDGALVIGALAVTDPLAAPFTLAVNNCTGVTLPLAASCTATARFAPTAAVLTSDTFDIPSNDPVTPTVSFSLSGTGTALLVPGISVTDSIVPANDQLVPFGTVTTGSSADATITITNPGTANLVIGTIAGADPLAPPFSILNDTCSSKTIAPSASCTLTIHFAPTANGLASDTLDIPSNVAGASSLAMTVNGTGGIATTGTVNNPPTNPVLVSPTNGQTGVNTTTTFVWKKSVDPDGDTVTHHVIYSTDPGFAVSQTVDVASAKSAGLLFAGLGSMGGGIILIGFVAGNGSRRSRITMLGIIALILIGTLFTACGGGGGGGTPVATTNPPTDQVSTTVAGLTPNTTYYWKVVADDGKGGLAASETFSFITQ